MLRPRFKLKSQIDSRIARFSSLLSTKVVFLKREGTMVNYYLASAIFHGVSSNKGLRTAYRVLGNKKTNRPITIGYTRWIWEQADKADCLKPGKRLLELGTGWTHANSLYVALVGDASIDTFDVVDNRSLPSLQFQVPIVLRAIETSSDHSDREKREARRRAARIAKCATLDEVYEVINMRYQVNEEPLFFNQTFDFIFAMDVLEHVRRERFQESVATWRALLKPGGVLVAQVGLDDHLSHLDRSKHVKHYLTHSMRVGSLLVETELKYINRLTASEILDAFRAAGFALERVDREICDMAGVTVHPDYRDQSPEDLAAARLTFVARKMSADGKSIAA
jgi:SAM-dependent methyltransferase